MRISSSTGSFHRAFLSLTAVCCLATLFLPGCATGPAATKGEIYYTQFSLFHEKDAWLTTNYRKGVLVPINTQVSFLKANSKEIFIQLPDASTLKIVNARKFSGVDVEGVFNRTLGKEKVDLDKFSPDEQNNIMAGIVAVGMSKDAVIKALGYPPKHKTPSLDGNQWRYWKNRYGTMLVTFADGRVSDIKK